MKIIVFVCVLAIGVADSDLRKRIINGEDVKKISDRPYQVSIRVFYEGRPQFNCGGVILSPTRILTAAHCLVDWDASLLSIKAGTLNVFDVTPDENAQIVDVESFVTHPLYTNTLTVVQFDIGIIYLKRPLQFNKNVKAAKIAPANSNFAGTVCRISGWGYVSGTGPVAPVLQQADITAISTEQCFLQWPFALINPLQVCVWEKSVTPADARPRACLGDSGGPLTCGKNKDLLEGVTSFGPQGCVGDKPNVYTSASKFGEWIREHL